MLATANLKKSKGNAITLAMVMLFVAMFINIAFVMLFGIGSFFDRRAEELNTGHFVTYLSQDEAFAHAQLQLLERDARVSSIEIQDFVTGVGEAFFGELPDPGLMMFSPVYQYQTMNPLTLIGDYLPLTGDAVYIPHFIMIGGNFTLGDTIRFLFMDVELSFTIAGSIDEILFGSINAWRRRMYVSDEMFYSLQRQFPREAATVMLARMYDVGSIGAFANDYFDYLLDLPPTADSQMIIATTTHFNAARNNHTLIPVIVGMILSVFAIVFLIVSLIVIRFRISNSIDEGMTNIGVLKALGYSSRQVMASILMQFGFIAAVGGVVGMFVSQLALPFVTTIFGPMFPFVWVPDINVPVKLVMLAFIVVCVLVFSLIAAARIYKLTPLTALRGGQSARKIKRNVLPFDKAGGPLAFLLAVKDVMQNKKQAVGIGLIIFGISFTAVVGIGTHYAVNVNNEEFLTALVGETFDITAAVRDANDAAGFVESMSSHPDVTGITGIATGVRLAVEDNMIFADVVEDHTQLRGNMLVAGRYPMHYNEIAISTAMLRATGKSIGDMVNVRSGGINFEFVITGQTQSMNGMVANITGDGMRRMQPFEFEGFMIFLADGVCGTAFAETLRETEGDIFAQIMVFDEIAESFIDSMGGIFAAISVAILTVVTAIVIATIYLVIKTAILRKRREFGIQKALGFTTFQLMNQVSLNLTPAILVGAAAGAVAAFNTFDYFFVVVTGVAGSMSVNIPMPLNWTIAASAGVVVLAYVVSMAVACRIRKISAYALVTAN